MIEKVTRSQQDLMTQYLEQLSFLKKSSGGYDSGDFIEAKRIALILRILLHDGKTNKSLFSLLSVRSDVCFLSTSSLYDKRNLMSFSGLVKMQIEGDSSSLRASYMPLLGEMKRGRWLDFDSWWSEVIIVDQYGRKFTRRKLILEVADTDGGAHVDEKLKKDYADLTRSNSMGWFTVNQEKGKDKVEGSVKQIELASIRQIAYEFLESVEKRKLNFSSCSD